MAACALNMGARGTAESENQGATDTYSLPAFAENTRINDRGATHGYDLAVRGQYRISGPNSGSGFATDNLPEDRAAFSARSEVRVSDDRGK
jgi:hypothetical protein